jgi:uncharacterized protein (DUF433 family)
MTLQIATDPVPLFVDEHGLVLVADTRVTLDSIVAGYQRGVSPREIHENHPDVPLADVFAVLAHYERHRCDVDAYLSRNRRRAAAIRREIESAPDLQTWARTSAFSDAKQWRDFR